MVFLGHHKKLNSKLVKEIQLKNRKFVLENDSIFDFEICGVILWKNTFNLKVCDYYGVLEIQMKVETESKGENVLLGEKGSFIFTVKPFYKNNQILYFLKDFRKVSLYEEIAFNLELKALHQISI
jgi:hypothetical protein